MFCENFRKRMGKVFAVVLVCACACLSGCEKGGTSSSNKEASQEIGAEVKEPSGSERGESGEGQASDESQSVEEVPKSALELALEIDDKDERLAALFELVLEDPKNEETLRAYVAEAITEEDLAECVSPCSEEFKAEQIKEHGDKIKEKGCKYAIFEYYDGNPANSYTVYYMNEKNQVIYTPEIWIYSPFWWYDGDKASDVTYYYDEDGRWLGSDRHVWDLLKHSYSGTVTTDKAVYNDQGMLTKLYLGGELYKEYKYNSDGSVVWEKTYGWNKVTDYKYGPNGYLVKVIENNDGDKWQSDYDEEERIKIIYDKDSKGSWRGKYLYEPNFDVTDAYYDENDERKDQWIDQPMVPYDYANGPVMEIKQTRTGTDGNTIRDIYFYLPNDRGDGFLEVATWWFVYDLEDETYKFRAKKLEDWNLFYIPE